MKSNLIFSILTASVLCCSCHFDQKDVETVKELDARDCQEIGVEQVFDSLEIIPLAFTPESCIKYAYHLVSCTDFYIIESLEHKIFVFDKMGHFVSSSETVRGRGKGEVGNVLGCTYNPYSKQIEILTPMSLFFFDIHFNFIRSVKLPYVKYANKDSQPSFFQVICDLSANRHILMQEAFFEHSGEMFFFDSEKEEIQGSISFKDQCIAPFSEASHFIYKDNFYIFPPYLTYNVYSLDLQNMKMHKAYHLNFGDKELTAEELGPYPTSYKDESRKKKAQYIWNCDKQLPSRHAICRDNLVVYVKNGDKKHLHEWYYLCFDLRDNTAKRYRLNKDPNLNYFQPEFRGDGDYLCYAVNEDEQVRSCIEHFKNKNNITINGKVLSDTVLFENGAILRYKLK